MSINYQQEPRAAIERVIGKDNARLQEALRNGKSMSLVYVSDPSFGIVHKLTLKVIGCHCLSVDFATKINRKNFALQGEVTYWTADQRGWFPIAYHNGFIKITEDLIRTRDKDGTPTSVRTIAYADNFHLKIQEMGDMQSPGMFISVEEANQISKLIDSDSALGLRIKAFLKQQKANAG